MCVGSTPPASSPGAASARQGWAGSLQTRFGGPPAATPPLPPTPSALGVEEADALRRRRGKPSDLEAQKRPLNPTGFPTAPRLGL